MLKIVLTAAVASTVAISMPAAAGDFCADADESAKVRAWFAENPGGMPVIAAQRIGMPEATVISALGDEQVTSAPGSAFAAVWDAMENWPESTFLIMKGANVFEIKSKIGKGTPSTRSSYYNIEYVPPVRGHLRPDLYASVFGVFISGDGPDPAASEIAKFDAVVDIIEAQPSVCGGV